MPVFECGAVRSTAGPAPRTASLESRPWCELEFVEVVTLEEGETHAFDRRRERERLIVADGAATVTGPEEGTVDPDPGTPLALDGPGGRFRAEASVETTLVRCCGTWGTETGGMGIFDVQRAPDADDGGDPVPYEKETAFDAHFHDCDEYFVILDGRAVVVTEDRFYEVSPGDVVATGMGHHHDVPQLLDAPLIGVFFETTMEGEKRRGHLHEHTDGPAEPMVDRV